MSFQGDDVHECNVATDALTDQFDALVESEIDPQWLARKLLKAKIITFNEMERVTDPRTRDSETDRRHHLMTYVIKKSRGNLQCFHQFLDVLDLEPALKSYAIAVRNYYQTHLEQQRLSVAITSPRPAETPPFSAMTPTQLEGQSGLPPFQSTQTRRIETAPSPGVVGPQLATIKTKICEAIACQPAVIHRLADELDCVGLITLDVQQMVKYASGKSPYERADAMISPAIKRLQSDSERIAPALVRVLNNVGLGYVTTESRLIAAVRPAPVPVSQCLPARGSTYHTQTYVPLSGRAYPSQPVQPVSEGVTKIEFCGDVARVIPSKWRLVGIALGVGTEQLDAVEQHCRGDQMECFGEVFDAWKNNPATVPFTWAGVVQALQRNFIKENALAMELARRHSVHEDSLKPPASLLKDPPTLPDFLDNVAFCILAKHYWFGLAIGVEDNELKAYSDLHRGDQLRCFESIFKYWKDRLPGAKPFKWSSVIEALQRRMIRENALARDLEHIMEETT